MLEVGDLAMTKQDVPRQRIKSTTIQGVNNGII